VVLGAFGSPTQICESWGLDLMNAWEDPQRQRTLARRARAINGDADRPSAREVFRILTDNSPRPGRRATTGDHDEIVRGQDGDLLFRIRYQRRLIALQLPVDRVSKESLREIRGFFTELLQHETEQLSGNNGEREHMRASGDRASPIQTVG
jgi:hypothetical protein